MVATLPLQAYDELVNYGLPRRGRRTAGGLRSIGRLPTRLRGTRSRAPGPKCLPVSEAVTHPDHFRRRQVPSELNEVGNVVDIELRADKEIAANVILDSHAGMNLEVVRTLRILAIVAVAKQRSGAGLLNVELGVGAADAADDLEGGFLGGVRLIGCIELVERNAVLQRLGDARGALRGRLRGRQQGRVVGLRCLNVGIHSHAEVLPKHEISTDADHHAAQAGRLLAVAGDCGARTGA